MERLTKRVDGIAVLESWAVGKDPVSVIQRLCSALAAHEDTGLEPVEIIGLKNTCEQLNGINDSLFKANQEMGKDLAEWKKARDEGRLVVLDEPMRPLVWGDKEHDTILCPRCLCDLMGGFEFAPSSETIIFQCPHCGQPIESDKAIDMEQSEADAALAGKGGDG